MRALAVATIGLSLLALTPGCGCGGGSKESTGASGGANAASDAGATTSVGDASTTAAATTPNAPAKTKIGAWLAERMPAGGRVVEAPDGTVKVMHKVQENEDHAAIAQKYLELSTVYLASDYTNELRRSFPALAAGSEIEIPKIVKEPFRSPEEERLGWPEDKSLRAIFMTAFAAQKDWEPTLDRIVTHGMNAVVLDAKDYTGPVTYATKAKVALEAKSVVPVIPNLERMIRFAHWKGVRVIMRISCFHDPIVAKKVERLSIQGTWGKAFPLGWLDPVNVEAQDFIIDLAKESIDAGADEIQLDYVRFPVFGGLKSAVMPPGHGGHRIHAIRDFVHRVHEVTQAKKVPLSLDIFGVTATGERGDIEMLGQDIAVLGKEAEALSPMVYPSHYDKGYRGFDEPGDHAEIVGIGTKAAIDQLKAVHDKDTVIRSWLQAFKWRSPKFGPKYIADQAKSAEANGGKGWLLWNPGCQYGDSWRAFPPVAKK